MQRLWDSSPEFQSGWAGSIYDGQLLAIA